jgi:hypothetical protein
MELEKVGINLILNTFQFFSLPTKARAGFFRRQYMSNEVGGSIRKQVIENGYQLRKASARLDTFVDVAPMILAALKSNSWFSPGAVAEISRWAFAGVFWESGFGARRHPNNRYMVCRLCGSGFQPR